MRKIVLDQFGQAWGYAETPSNVREIFVFSEMAGDSPVNVRLRKVSANKKYEKQLRKQGGYEIFIPWSVKDNLYRY